MVAMVRTQTREATNIVKRATSRAAPVQAREKARTPVALRMWLCAEAFSARGFALDLSEHGARLGGVGVRFRPGEQVLAKILLNDDEAPLVLKAEVVRYQPVSVRASACPELCIRFTDGSLDDRFRLGRFLDALTA
jgi:PilZ domain